MLFSTRSPWGALLLFAILCVVSCSDGDTSQSADDVSTDVDNGSNDGSDDSDDPTSDLGVSDAGSDELDTNDPDVPLMADGYCEATGEMFCAYYMRCGRMAAANVSECLDKFAEACNAVYEPYYAELEEMGLLSLSAAGIEQCADHLAAVDCDRQLNDLDGECSRVWTGHAPNGAACGIGIESFVCAPAHSCVLGMDFCGVCEPIAALGQDCNDLRCSPQGHCLDGVCAARGMAGDECGESAPCIVGASCVEGRCQVYEVMEVGDLCDREHRCPYASVCAGGTCARQSMLGEACAAAGWCASGWCAASGNCADLKEPGAECEEGRECVGGRCTGGRCGGFASGCLQ